MDQFDAALNTELRQTQAALNGALPTIPWCEIDGAQPADSLIKGVIYRNTLAAVIGAAGSGKTFFVNDLAFHISIGWDWRGHRVKHAGVLYIALEGAAGIANRVAALKAHHDAHGDGVGEPPAFNLSVVSLDLLNDPAAVQRVIKTALALENIGLIVIDTAARAMCGGDENSSADMGKFIRNLDRIREATGACVLIVHHTGKDAAKGARGHSSLRAAIDTEIEVTKADGGPRIAKITKQKDGIDGLEFAFDLHVVELGEDEDGDPITSCVCKPTVAIATRKQKITGPAGVLLSAIHEAIADAGVYPPASHHIPPEIRAVSLETARDYAARRGLSAGDTPDANRKAFKRAIGRLQTANAIGIWGDWIWPA